MSEKKRGGSHGSGPPMARPVEKAKDFRGTLKRLLSYLRSSRRSLIMVVIFAVIATSFTVLGPKIAGNAMNDITDGFVAKSVVDGLDKAQPALSDALDSYNKALKKARTRADDAVEKGAESSLKQQKETAYSEAEKKAEAAVEEQFSAALAEKKEAAYAQAETKAEAAAKSKVDAEFMQSFGITEDQLSDFPGYSGALKKACKTADTQAKAAVDAVFQSRQSEFDSQLAKASQTAEEKARAAVDSAFESKQSDIDKEIAAAKTEAEKKAKDAVDKAFMEKMDLNQKQFDTFLELAALPRIKSTDNFDERGDIAEKFINAMKILPSSMFSDNSSVRSADIKMTNISDKNLQRYINDIRTTGGNIPYDVLWKTVVLLLSIYVLSSLFMFFMNYIMSSVAQNVVYDMRKEVDRKLFRIPLRYYDSHTNGEILSRVTNDMDTISSTLQQSLTQLIQAVLQIAGYIIMMLTISRLLTLFVMLTLPLYIFVTTFIARKSQKYFKAQQKHLGILSGHTEEMYTGHKIVKAFGRKKEAINTFRKVNDDLYEAGWKAQFLSGVMFPLMNFISNIGYVLIAVIGGVFVTKTWLNIGDITAFIQYSRQFSMPIIQTANIANIIQSTIACAERVFEVLDEDEELPDAKDAAVLPRPQGNIVFDHVDFSYKKTEPLIRDMNLEINKGDTVAIVGPTGAGKTTLVNLLMRFYEIQGGRITFDGVDIREIRRTDLRRMFGMVLQDTWLFNGTVEDNIRYGRDGSSFDDIVSAAKTAHADHFIRSLPDGYKMVLNEEASNISQGQKQLLTIARAILADPSVLILDEATSYVDTRTEVLIQKAMNELMKGRTNFVIAHRLSTIRDAKTILVMNHGSIVESGSHRELLEKKGFYADLYNSQFTGPSLQGETK
mgnify:CR=1 FL=1